MYLNILPMWSYAMDANNSRQIVEKKSGKYYSIVASEGELYIHRRFGIAEIH